MKKFFAEFKKFIMRGNVLDMAVGVIVGGAFTGIVNGLSNYILKPIINWLLSLIIGSNGLEGAVSFLSKAYTTDSNGATIIDLANSIYIDWGAFISAIINFFIIAFVLFMIVKTINKISEERNSLTEKIKNHTLSKQERKEIKQAGISLRDKQAVKKYLEDKKAKKEAEELALKQEEEAKALAERLANPTDNDLLKRIVQLLEKNEK